MFVNQVDILLENFLARAWRLLQIEVYMKGDNQERNFFYISEFFVHVL